jgi:N-acetyl-anhydromuramyl-L-alanine amidase AmpD/photosystem II stability/assembly factor-like uncharacterized protein
MRRGSNRAAVVSFVAIVALAGGTTGAAGSAPGGTRAAIREAASEFRVPTRLLRAVGYLNTRWHISARPALDGGYGPMNLTPAQLRRAAQLAPIAPKRARRDLAENVRAGAALLAAEHRGGSWRAAVGRLWGRPLADEVAARLGWTSRRLALASAATADYPGARWLPASRADYAAANRPLSNRISTIVIHATEGSYAGTLKWFRNPAARASAHYVVRSSDGEVTQMVREKDEAWHAGNGAVNASSVGIEHEAFTGNCAWYTDALYRASAQLSAYLVTKYLIPADRKHIIGHAEVPDPNHAGQFGGFAHHTDPGRCWDWSKYMALVRDFAGARIATTLQRVRDDSKRGFVPPSGWKRGASAGAYARSFLVTRPRRGGKVVRFGVPVPVAGRYAVYAWWPGAPSRNSSVPVGVETPSGITWQRVDERVGGGWRYLGTYSLSTRGTAVRFSPQTTAPGSIAADAVKIELLAPQPSAELRVPSDGWIGTRRGLATTQDAGGSWTTLAPPGVAGEQVRGAHVDGASAWLVVAPGASNRPLALYRTSDRGAHWTITRIPATAEVDVAAAANVAVVDPAHVFVSMRLEPSRWSLSRGLLLRTTNGGATWARSPLPAGGEVTFESADEGWLAGGLRRERLYVTHDGGRTWRRSTPPAPVKGAASIAYAVPTFPSADEGVLAVSAAAGARSTVAFETTTDGGLSWSIATLLPVGSALRVASYVPTAVADPASWFAAVRTKLIAVTDAGLARSTVGTLPGPTRALHFTSPTLGWAEVAPCSGAAATCQVKLYGTRDGGVTWKRLRPG